MFFDISYAIFDGNGVVTHLSYPARTTGCQRVHTRHAAVARV